MSNSQLQITSANMDHSRYRLRLQRQHAENVE